MQVWWRRRRGGGANPRGETRGPLSRGLFGSNLLSLYNDAGSFHVKDDDDKDGYNNGYNEDIETATMMAAALTIAGWQATTKRAADGAINNHHCTRRRRILHHG